MYMERAPTVFSLLPSLDDAFAAIYSQYMNFVCYLLPLGKGETCSPGCLKPDLPVIVGQSVHSLTTGSVTVNA